MFGGKCTLCGYSKCVAALQFHHPNKDKEFGIAYKGKTRKFLEIVTEAEKCMLICANCHAEQHFVKNGEYPNGEGRVC